MKKRVILNYLYWHYKNRMSDMVYRILGSHSKTEEVMKQAFLKLKETQGIWEKMNREQIEFYVFFITKMIATSKKENCNKTNQIDDF